MCLFVRISHCAPLTNVRRGDMGRSSKLTAERHDKIIEALRAGNYFDAACGYAGICEKTGYNWLERGRTARNGKYVQFLQAVEKASVDAEVGTVAVIKKASIDTWQAAAWWLERRFPNKWGRKVQDINAKIETWQDRAIADIREGKIDYKDLADAFDTDLATQLFARAGVPVSYSED